MKNEAAWLELFENDVLSDKDDPRYDRAWEHVQELCQRGSLTSRDVFALQCLIEVLTQPAPLPVEDGEITQGDREAAWSFANFGHLPDRQERERWYCGYYDDHPVGRPIRAFARHRQQSLSEAQALGQEEGKRTVLNWLRERSAMKPPAILWSAAEILAEQFEASEIPALSTTQEKDDA